MVASTASKSSRIEQCRKNAKDKSEAKYKAFLDALALQSKEGKPLTKAAICKRAGVTPPFLRAHPDLLRTLERAQNARLADGGKSAISSENQGKDRVIEALKRQLDARQAVIAAKDAENREKDRQIRILLGKLAANSPLTDSDLKQQLDDALRRVERAETKVKDLETRLFAKRVVKTRDQIRRLEKNHRSKTARGSPM